MMLPVKHSFRESVFMQTYVVTNTPWLWVLVKTLKAKFNTVA
ncbi:hypothetical protein [Zooshikella sp. RANM57]